MRKVFVMLKVIAVSTVATLVLAGCAPSEPQVFGVPQSQWNQLSKKQQHQVIKSYNRQQEIQARSDAERAKIDAQNAPVTDLISATKSVVDHRNNNGFPDF